VWLIEGHGVDPDVVKDNLPHATFKGEDAQLEAAIRHLQEEIAKDPRPVPKAPAYPNPPIAEVGGALDGGTNDAGPGDFGAGKKGACGCRVVGCGR
jgi:hypothetical protein